MEILKCTTCYYNGSEWMENSSSFPLNDLKSIVKTENPLSHPEGWFVLTLKDDSTHYILPDFRIESRDEMIPTV